MASNWELIVHGDAEAAVIDILRNNTAELAGLGITFSSDLVGYETGSRWVMVTQEGSSEDWPKVDKPRIDIEIYAANREDAKDIGAICLGSLKRAMGNYTGKGLKITDCKLELGLTRVPDKLSESPRYICAVRLTCVPSGSPMIPDP